ncbi:mRNA export factor GLE1-like [Humulus lupulus]|uniref:mRNA export factor GLE1-like n=1 Tax=Humulus lupulus TaxID=3486 RepID=UPI002B415AA8|nr:mRNA export factor GLE1-like [Humulus lupulus]
MGAECWNECLKLLGVAEAAEASMVSDQLSSGISDFDTHFQGLIVQKSVKALDNHLTAIQRDHELRSQIEERKIRSDAAYEGAKRKEKALLEEKLRQEKAKAEAEAKLIAEEANRAAMEAQRREEKEAAEKEANEASSQAAVQKEALGLQTKAKTKDSEFEKPINSASTGNLATRKI